MDVSENSGFSFQIIHLLIRFSMIFTIHFGVFSLFLDVSGFRVSGFGFHPRYHPDKNPDEASKVKFGEIRRWERISVVVFGYVPSIASRGAGIFIYVYHKNQPNVGIYIYTVYMVWELVCNS